MLSQVIEKGNGQIDSLGSRTMGLWDMGISFLALAILIQDAILPFFYRCVKVCEQTKENWKMMGRRNARAARRRIRIFSDPPPVTCKMAFYLFLSLSLYPLMF